MAATSKALSRTCVPCFFGVEGDGTSSHSQSSSQSSLSAGGGDEDGVLLVLGPTGDGRGE